MKYILLLLVMASTVTLSANPLPTRGAGYSVKEKAVVQFNAPTKLLSVVLLGEYLFVHDEKKMEAGEDCTYVYKMEAGRPVRLVISFHCIPVPRSKAANFTMRTSLVMAEPELYELYEYQFAGSSEGHQVPSSPEALRGTVNLVPCCQ